MKHKSDFLEILSSQFISVSGGLIAGTLLAIWTDKILLIPGMLILLPGFLELRGNINGTLAARVASGMFLGRVKPNKLKSSRIVRGNIIASFSLAMALSLLLGLLAFSLNLLVFKISYPKIILIPFLAGLFANSLEIPLTIFFTTFLFKKGHDPDNIMGPFISTTGDLTSILSLLAVILLI